MVFTLDFGKDGLKKTNEITIDIDGEELTYVISENTKKAYEAELEYEGNTILEISIDKSNETYTLKLGDGYLTIKGDFIQKGDTTTITVTKLTSSYSYGDGTKSTDSIKTDITIVIDEKDNMPDVPSDFDRISDITDKDIEKWIEDLPFASAKEDIQKVPESIR